MRATHYLTVSATALLIGTTGLTSPAQAQTTASVAPTHVIYSFSALYRTPKESGSPSSDLAVDGAGNLYGVTVHGGHNSCLSECGTIYRLVPAARGQVWTEQTLYSFPSFEGRTGRNPLGKPLLDSAGNIYGTAEYGGTVGQPGTGTVWKLSPPATQGAPWELTVLYTFSPPPQGRNGGPDGGVPVAGLVMDRSGTLYGTTDYGGSADKGVVFSLTPPAPGGLAWTETVLHSFTGRSDGGHPIAPLVLSDRQTAISGTTLSGTVFRLRHQGGIWSYRRLYSLGCDTAAGLLADRAGNLFGTAYGFCTSPGPLGGVFELSPPALGQTAWTEQVLHAFTGKDGRYPVAGLVAGGSPRALFGTTSFGGMGGAVDGSRGPYGVVFRLDPPASGSGAWTYTVLHALDGPPRGKRLGLLRNGLAFKRLLYGVSTRGGSEKSGAVFALSPQVPAAPPTGAAP